MPDSERFFVAELLGARLGPSKFAEG